MNDNRMVVVVTRATTVRLESHDDVFAARFKKLGLTAYGHNKTEAMSNLKKLFNRYRIARGCKSGCESWDFEAPAAI